MAGLAHFKMPKVIRELEKLPDRFEIKSVIGPLKVAPIGNGGHLMIPKKFVGANGIYVVKGEVNNGNKISSNLSCENCNDEQNVVSCDKVNADVCVKCCSKCPYLKKCPIRQAEKESWYGG